ncbi:thaumatin-like protein 1, partial [Tanacetum coccineum]
VGGISSVGLDVSVSVLSVWAGMFSAACLTVVLEVSVGMLAGDLWSFQAPKDWSGTLWVRTSCTFYRSGHGSCKTGDCGSGELECNGGSATPPVKLAKFTISLFFGLEYLYVSLAKGYKLQMTVEATGWSGLFILDCAKTGCVHNLNHQCPKELMLKGGGGCKSACQAFGSPEANLTILRSTSVYNADEQYFSYEDSYAAFPMWILTPEGKITDGDKSTAWTLEFCYGYDLGDGCVEESSLPLCREKMIILTINMEILILG